MVHGIVIEQATSRPVSRATVKLQTVIGGELRTLTTALTNRSGQYWFPSLEDGRYFVAAHRATYLEMQYGQRRAKGRGDPIIVKGNETVFAEIRLRKLGAITGRIVDENRVALPETNVIAYPAKLPLIQAATAKTDDRGVFRLAGLSPGGYWVRSAAKELEDGTGLLPTFFPMTTESKDAKAYGVELDTDVTDLEMQPLPGKLIKVRGKVAGCSPNEAFIRVTLAFDSGRRETNAACPLGTFSFDGLPPASYEILAVPGSAAPITTAAYEETYLDRDVDLNLQLTDLPVLSIRLEKTDRSEVKPNDLQIRLRRRDLAGTGDFYPRNNLLPGAYELFFQTGGTHYVERVTLLSGRRRTDNPLLEIAPVVHLGQSARTSVAVLLGTRAATVEGVVKHQDQASLFTPVYLYPRNVDLSRRMNGTRSTYTDRDGRFRFTGIAPGNYWMISTIDLDEISSTTLEHARADELLLGEGETKQIELRLYEQR